ncbi:hypothetical protein GQ457_01G054210 [Hibiscus cannabinus]
MTEEQVPNEGSIWAVTAKASFVKELKNVCSMAVIFAAMSLLQYLLQVTSLMMAGHLGELSLSSVAIASSFCNLCGKVYVAQQDEKVGTTHIVKYSQFFLYISRYV